MHPRNLPSLLRRSPFRQWPSVLGASYLKIIHTKDVVSVGQLATACDKYHGIGFIVVKYVSVKTVEQVYNVNAA